MKKNVLIILLPLLVFCCSSCGHIGGYGVRKHEFKTYEEMIEFYNNGPYKTGATFPLFDTSYYFDGKRDFFTEGTLYFQTNTFYSFYYYEHNVLPYHFGTNRSSVDSFEYFLVFYEKNLTFLENIEWEKREKNDFPIDHEGGYGSDCEKLIFILKTGNTRLVDIRFHGVPNESYEYYDEEACNLLYQKIEEIKSIVKDLCIEAYNS